MESEAEANPGMLLSGGLLNTYLHPELLFFVELTMIVSFWMRRTH